MISAGSTPRPVVSRAEKRRDAMKPSSSRGVALPATLSLESRELISFIRTTGGPPPAPPRRRAARGGVEPLAPAVVVDEHSLRALLSPVLPPPPFRLLPAEPATLPFSSYGLFGGWGSNAC